MAKVLRAVDIGESLEIIRFVEETLSSGEPVILRHLGRDLAVLQPLEEEPLARRRRVLTPEEQAAFAASAGAWKDLEGVDDLVRYINGLRGRPDDSSDELPVESHDASPDKP